jgi:hypothetical protein
MAASVPGLAGIVLNIRVKLPGEEGAVAPAASAVGSGIPEPGEELADDSSRSTSL